MESPGSDRLDGKISGKESSVIVSNVLADIARDFVAAEIRYKRAIGAGFCDDELHEAIRDRDRLFLLLSKVVNNGENR